MASSPCSRCSMTQLALSTRVAASVRDPSLCTLSRGTAIYTTFCSSERTTVRKKWELETCSTLSGSPTCLWGVLRLMKTGPWCALMSVQVFPIVGEKSLRIFTPHMKNLDEEERKWRLNGSGNRSLRPRLKPVFHIWFTRIRAIESRTNRTLEPSSAPISALKYWSTLVQMR